MGSFRLYLTARGTDAGVLLAQKTAAGNNYASKLWVAL